MTDPVGVFPALHSKVTTGGTSVVVFLGPMLGGIIQNPKTAAEQGLAVAEELYVDFINPATVGTSVTTFALAPGETAFVPPNQITNVYANSASSGHQFAAIVFQPAPNPPTPVPPEGPLLGIIPSYLYVEYNDDDTLQAFVAAYNKLATEYFNDMFFLNLPVYTGLAGLLLDWVAAGLYGFLRPALSSGSRTAVGPYNTEAWNTEAYNSFDPGSGGSLFVTDDDTFKRIITWHFFKGDGKVFDIRWLKRRLKRFMIGVNGTNPNIDETYDVSVTFAVGNQVNIQLLTNSPILKDAIDSGALELPFQFEWVVTTP